MNAAVMPAAGPAAQTLGLRERKKQQTRESIAAAAAQLFDELGYENARTAEIARRANVGEATVFRYFPTKADLGVEQVRRAFAKIVAALSSRPVSESPYEAVLAAASHGVVAALVADRPSRIVHLLNNEEVASRTFFVVLQACNEVARDFGRRLGRSADSPEAKVLAQAAVGAVVTGLREWLKAPEPKDALAVFCRHIEVLRPILDVGGTP